MLGRALGAVCVAAFLASAFGYERESETRVRRCKGRLSRATGAAAGQSVLEVISSLQCSRRGGDELDHGAREAIWGGIRKRLAFAVACTRTAAR